MMDAATIRAVEASIYAAGYPTDAAAVLLIELDGAAAGIDDDAARVAALLPRARARAACASRPIAAERARLWQGRKKAFGAMGRISPHLVVQDAVVPRTKLPAVLAEIQRIGERHGVKVCNVFHAGDGNLHPNIGYDATNADESERVHQAMSAIMQACIDAGGTITGEHGVGLDKLPVHGRRSSRRRRSARCARCATCSIRRAGRIRARSCRCTAAASGTPTPCRARGDASAVSAHRRRARPRDAASPQRVRAARAARARRSASSAAATGSMPAARAAPTRDHRPRDADAGIVEYEPGDLTLTARAGTTLAELARVTRAEGQWLPLDPYGRADGTIGATSPPRRPARSPSSFGTPRDQVLGCEFVDRHAATSCGRAGAW